MPFTSKKSKQNLKTKKSKKSSKTSNNETSSVHDKDLPPQPNISSEKLSETNIEQSAKNYSIKSKDSLKNERELNEILRENSRQIIKEQKLHNFSSSSTTTTSSTNPSSILASMNKISKKTSIQSQSSIEQQHAQTKPQQKHQPYATSLVNSGFGFGFDLQGGEADNQLTYIINVKPNGDAARKGLSDGKNSVFLCYQSH